MNNRIGYQIRLSDDSLGKKDSSTASISDAAVGYCASVDRKSADVADIDARSSICITTRAIKRVLQRKAFEGNIIRRNLEKAV